MKKLIIVFVFSILVMYSCNKSTSGPSEDPVGYQKDIPWPSLADSPWPIDRGDAQGTGRSKSLGPKLGTLTVIYDSLNIYCGFVVDKDSNIYTSGKSWRKQDFASMYLFSFKKNNQMNLSVKLNNTFKNFITPICLSDGSIIYGDDIYQAGAICCIDKTGNLKWKYNTNETFQSRVLGIDKESNVYVVSANGLLHAIDKQGNMIWQLQLETHQPVLTNGGVFSPDGKTLYILGISSSLIAIDIQTRAIKWKFGQKRMDALPLVDNDGYIYLCGDCYTTDSTSHITKLSPQGTIVWRYNSGSSNNVASSDPTLDRFGNFYCAFNNKLVSIKISGELNWTRTMPGNVVEMPLICDSENIIYAPASPMIIAYDKNGSIVFQTQNTQFLYNSSAGLFNGKLIFSTDRDKLTIIE